MQHAGEGGLYAELVQDRGFEGISYFWRHTAFAEGPASGLTVSRDVTFFMQNWPLTALPESTDPQSWSLSTGNAWLSNMHAATAASSAYLTIHCISGPAILVNHGFWGIPVQEGAGYELAMYLRSPDSCQVCSCCRGAKH